LESIIGHAINVDQMALQVDIPRHRYFSITTTTTIDLSLQLHRHNVLGTNVKRPNPNT